MTSFDWIDFDQLKGIEKKIRQVFDQAGDYMDGGRKDAIISAFSSRLGNLMALSRIQSPTDDPARDVERDAAQDYGLKTDI